MSVTVPALIGRRGAGSIEVWDLAAGEAAALHRSAEAVRGSAAGVSPVA